jgi:hypothetical protein
MAEAMELLCWAARDDGWAGREFDDDDGGEATADLATGMPSRMTRGESELYLVYKREKKKMMGG